MAENNDFAMGYAMGQDSGGNCNDGLGFGGGWGGLIGLLIVASLFGGDWGFGGGFGGWGMGGMGGGMMLNGIATRADINEGFALQNITGGIRGIEQGLCNGFHDQTVTAMGGFHGVDNAICNLGYQMQQGFNTLGYQAKDCCCETQRLIERGFCDIGYNMATNTANIVQSGRNDTDRVIAKLDAMENARQAEKIEALRLENQTLRFQASQAAQNAFITANQDAQTAELIRRLGRDCPIPAYVVPNPNCCYGNPVGVGYGGCGNGCVAA